MLSNGLKYFQFWVRFCWVISIFFLSPGYHILGRVNLPRVSYCAESISPGYHTRASYLLKFVLKSLRGIIPQGVNIKSTQTWLTGVWYPAHWGQEQLFFGPKPITQAVVVLHPWNLYFWILHRWMRVWCEEKNFNILMRTEKSMLKRWKNMYSLSLLYLSSWRKKDIFKKGTQC